MMIRGIPAWRVIDRVVPPLLADRVGSGQGSVTGRGLNGDEGSPGSPENRGHFGVAVIDVGLALGSDILLVGIGSDRGVNRPMNNRWWERLTGVRGPLAVPALYGLVAGGICLVADLWPHLSLARQVHALLLAGIWLAAGFVQTLARLSPRLLEPAPLPTIPDEDWEPLVALLIQRAGKIEAIRWVRAVRQCTLTEAKQFVDAVAGRGPDKE